MNISEYHNDWSKNTASTPINEHFWISQRLEKKYSKHTNVLWLVCLRIFTPVVVMFRNVLWLVCLLYFYSSRCDIQKCSLIGVLAVFFLQSLWYSEDISEYHNYWSKNTASTPIKGHFWISQLLE
jgi:type III secretory pathway component EscS